MSDAIELFDQFIVKRVDPSLHGHLFDSDDNDGEYVRRAIRALEAEHADELARIASWQRDARRAFAKVEQIADDPWTTEAVATALRDALGEQFLTPKVES